MVNGKAPSRMSNQKAAFELKQRVVLALNKVADRDTYQLGVEELEKIIECLMPDGVATLLSCILDTDCEKKSAVRKECIRLMGTLATLHGGLIGPYLGKMVASIVKRLKDSDSIVRDACVETAAVLASKLSSYRTGTDGTFVALVRPLFEALGEQNKQVQYGSALCLSRVIDTILDPPPLVLQKMLERTVKLLKSPNFMAKPAVIELNRSIILAGGAPTRSYLTTALKSIQESLKNNDWATRKAACAALGDIASCGAVCLASYRTSCIQSLESCRFDKVKPVRDIALQALQLWRDLHGANTSEPSEAGSSVKETSYRDDYGDITNLSESKLKDDTFMKSKCEFAKKRVPFTSRKSGRTYSENSQNSGTNDWQVEIALPNSYKFPVTEDQNDESECSSVTKRCDKTKFDVRRTSSIGHRHTEVDERQECSSGSNPFTKTIKSEVVSANSDAFSDPLVMSIGSNQRFAVDENGFEEQRNSAKIHDRRSLDSTVTESTSLPVLGFYSPAEKDIELIRNHLLEIESKQSSLLEMLKTFTTSIMDSVSIVQLKVSNLELVVDKMAQELGHRGRYPNVLATKILKRSPCIATPRLSTSTTRLSVDSNKQPLLQPTKHAGLCVANTSTRTISNSSLKQNLDTWEDATFKPSKSPLGKGSPSFIPEILEDQMRRKCILNLVPHTKVRLNNLATKDSTWNVMKDYLSDGNLESAYIEALYSRNELPLFELLDRTGPVLEHLSERTASDLLSTLALYLNEQRFLNSIIPWLQQFVDICKIHGSSYLMLSTNAKRDLLLGIQEASKLWGQNPAERKCFTEIGKTLHQLWG